MLIKTQPTGLGYLLLDHRASPELPEGVPRAYFEADTYTCTHCGCVVVMNPDRKRERYNCRGCSHLICDNCAAERVAGAPCKTLRQKIAEEFDRVERTGSPLILPERFEARL